MQCKFKVGDLVVPKPCTTRVACWVSTYVDGSYVATFSDIKSPVLVVGLTSQTVDGTDSNGTAIIVLVDGRLYTTFDLINLSLVT